MIMINMQVAAIARHKCNIIFTLGLFRYFQRHAINMKVSSRNSKEHAQPMVAIDFKYSS